MSARRKQSVSESPPQSPAGPSARNPEHVPTSASADSGQTNGQAFDPRTLGAESDPERRAKTAVPWLISITAHAALIFLGFVLTWTVAQMRGEGEGQSLVVADAEHTAYEPVLLDEVDETDAEDPFEEAFDIASADIPSDDLFVDIDPAPATLAPDMPAAGNPAEFTPPPASGAVSFMGLSAHDAQRIVYLIDASGRMIPYLQFVIQELERSLESLQPQQEFALVFIQRNEAQIAPPRRLVRAGATERYRALEWISRNIVPAGRSNPVAGFEAALQLNPDVIFVLSGNITGAGIYEVDQEELLERLDDLNPRHRRTGERPAAINCIQFLDPDELETLKKIAEAHGGTDSYKFLSRRELGLAR